MPKQWIHSGTGGFPARMEGRYIRKLIQPSRWSVSVLWRSSKGYFKEEFRQRLNKSIAWQELDECLLV